MTASLRVSGFRVFVAAALAVFSNMALAQTTVDPTAGVPSTTGTTATPVLQAQAYGRIDKLTRVVTSYDASYTWPAYLGSTGYVLEHFSDAAGTIPLAAAPPITTTTLRASFPQPSGVWVIYSRMSVYGPAGKLDQSNLARLEFPSTAATRVWTPLGATARDVGLGGAEMWTIGANAVSTTGYGVFRWVNGAPVAVLAKGGGKRIDVDAGGMAWIVDGLGNVQRFTGTVWAPVYSGAIDVGVGADGTAWIIAGAAETGGYGVYRGSASTPFTKVTGGAVKVDVDQNGNAWIVNSSGQVRRWNGTGWTGAIGVTARDVGIGADDSVFVTATDGAIYRWSGTAWVRRDGLGVSLSVDPSGVPVRIDGASGLYRGWK